MSAWMRVVGGVVVLALGPGPAQAGPLTDVSGLGWAGSRANLSTIAPSWHGTTSSSAATRAAPVVPATPATPSPAPAPVAPPQPDFAPPADLPAPAPPPVPTPSPAPAPPPTFAPAPAPLLVSAPAVMTATPVPPPPPSPSPPSPSPPPADAFINLGGGPFPNADTVTTGGASPWYATAQGPTLSLFGGPPTAQQQADFTSAVLQRVEHTFLLAGLQPNLTADPSAPAAHTLSLVSNTLAAKETSAIGMTYVGGNGFSFVDPQAKVSQSLDQLEWVAAHNLSHELMLAFGVGENYDTTGHFIDARNANLAMMTSPDATFSAAAAAALKQALAAGVASDPALGAQFLEAQIVPEPASVAVWGLGGLALAAWARRRAAVTARPPV